MALNTNKIIKRYYSISEVSKMLGVSETTLRYWETQMPQLNPKTRAGSNVRQYEEKDLEVLRNIYNLVKVRGFRISAARKYLSENRQGVEKKAEILSTLISVRDELKNIKQQLDTLV